MEALIPRITRGAGTSASEWRASGLFDRVPVIRAEDLVPVESRAVIIAPHPDDEVLGMGGLMAQLAALGQDILLIAITDGTASHPGSTIWTPAKLAKARPAETIKALHQLQLEHIPIVRAGFPDGALVNHEQALTSFISSLLHPDDVVFAPWRFDGQPDNETVGLASAVAARESRASLVEVPIWAWHWANPASEEVPWHRARRVQLDDTTYLRKRQAALAYKSQLLPDSSTEREAVVSAAALARLVRDEEIFFV